MSIQDLFKSSVVQSLTSSDFTMELIFTFMAISLAFSLYVFAVYRFANKSNFYSAAFGKTLVGMSIVTTAIIIAMQTSLVVSLGMVGALSIVRFRNAVKAPQDLLFLFWAISNGIICGTGMFNISIVLCVMMSVVVLGLDFIPVGRASYILMVNGDHTMRESEVLEEAKEYAKNVSVRTRSLYDGKRELLVELRTRKGESLLNACNQLEGVTNVSLIYHDGEVRF
ncbi:MAG: DUF4956 domain-containing protein [Faecalibacterium sp.]